jgi:hypothetical protein
MVPARNGGEAASLSEVTAAAGRRGGAMPEGLSFLDQPRRRAAAWLALAALLALAACAGGPERVPGSETTTRDINEDIRATMPVGPNNERPILPGAGQSLDETTPQPPSTTIPLPPP